MAGDNPTYQELNKMFWDSVRIVHEQQKEIDSLKEQLQRVKSSAITGMNAAKEISSAQLREAHKLFAQCGPEALESERAMNAILTEENVNLHDQLSTLKRTYNQLFDAFQAEQNKSNDIYELQMKQAELPSPFEPYNKGRV